MDSQSSESGHFRAGVGGAAPRRRYLMVYVVAAVAVSTAICIAAAVRAATRSPDGDGPSVRPIATAQTPAPTPSAPTSPRSLDPSSASNQLVAKTPDPAGVTVPPPAPAAPQGQARATAADRSTQKPAARPPAQKPGSKTILRDAPF